VTRVSIERVAQMPLTEDEYLDCAADLIDLRGQFA
jgi:hypothetical protein